ncbi:peptidyl-prolyl cis-trans isomerase [Phenylobacterium soli]|uniref:Parvulin-like PPIase n=1 Tax=Phenylobacterium soli TaxID=2170551 RepID=A0A328AK23_9CAUL|nr:peptidylprolyl isomerase [Phenylobacterium soli]RAK54821.1 peptidyl-prolyl cis-trans isomerase [Phenylobacterium soli]
MASIAETQTKGGWTAPLIRPVRRAAREPLVHFLLIGAVLFLLLTAVRAGGRPTVRISEQELNQLVGYWQMQSGRPPTKTELAAILQDRVDEELLAREAQRLGLDREDMIVRRRLAQKMAFASEDVGAIPEPAEAQLRDYYAQHRNQYATPAHIAMRQVVFSADRGPQAQAAAAEALAELRRGGSPAGDPFLLPLSYADVSPADLTRDYGAEFARTIQAAPLGTWIGPITSPYGVHLVRVEGRQGADVAAFDAVRSDVRDAWIAERRAANNAAFLKSLRKRYRVVVAGEAQ